MTKGASVSRSSSKEGSWCSIATVLFVGMKTAVYLIYCMVIIFYTSSVPVWSQENNVSSIIQTNVAFGTEDIADSGEQESRRDAEELYEKAIQLRYTTENKMVLLLRCID